MGYDTRFYGRLEFNRRLTREELGWLQKVRKAGRFGRDEPEIEAAVMDQAEARRSERGAGPLLFDAVDGADLRAEMRGFIVGKNLSPHNAEDLRITSDGAGLEYCSEKSYNMVEGVNFIVANARLKIPGFGLQGSLFADTEFEPYRWLLKIGADGWAHQEPCRITELLRHDARAYMRHVRWNWRKPSVW
jgi:hypothetical protein